MNTHLSTSPSVQKQLGLRVVWALLLPAYCSLTRTWLTPDLKFAYWGKENDGETDRVKVWNAKSTVVGKDMGAADPQLKWSRI